VDGIGAGALLRDWEDADSVYIDIHCG